MEQLTKGGRPIPEKPNVERYIELRGFYIQATEDMQRAIDKKHELSDLYDVFEKDMRDSVSIAIPTRVFSVGPGSMVVVVLLEAGVTHIEVVESE